MRFARPIGGVAALCALAAAAAFYAATPARSFDLQSSQATVKRPAADITDTYLFPSPTNPGNVVAIMDVDPLLPAGSGSTAFFDPNVLYTMRFDNRYAAEAKGTRPVEDLVIQFTFGQPSSGTQQVFVYGPAVPNETGATTTLVDSASPDLSGFVNRSFGGQTLTSSVTVFAGVRRDPAFFNGSQFFSIFPDRNGGSTATSCLTNGTCPAGFTAGGGDFFAQTNVLSIAVELPRSALEYNNNGACSNSSCPLAYWATTSTPGGN